MAWIEPISTAITAASIANDISKSSSLIRKHANRLVYRIKNGALVVPIFGAGGAGKSTAARLLGGEDPLDIFAAYSESFWVEPVNLTGDIPGQILAAPGQDVRADKHWPELLSSVVQGKAIGIINIVSYGYHAIQIPTYKDHDLYNDGMTENEFMNLYLSERRVKEEDFAEKLVNGLFANENPIWMITLITKQDLWWDKREAVKEHYTTGRYNEIINRLSSELGSKGFQHEYIPVSLAIGNMKTETGETLASTVSGYDMPIHLAYLNSMFSKIYEVIEH